ncbi:MAG: hypothetical protein FWG90_13490 [Oscillospiraceae bacterium]|nr:hypothetical protein [Oscillospiraceae bacterium]
MNTEFWRRSLSLASVALSLFIPLLAGFAADSAVHTDVDLARLGVMTALVLALIPIKAVLDYFRLRASKTDLAESPKPNGLLERELKTAPLEITARRYKYKEIVSNMKKSYIRQELHKAVISSAKVLGSVSLVALLFYLSYRGSIAFGAAAAVAFYLLSRTDKKREDRTINED